MRLDGFSKRFAWITAICLVSASLLQASPRPWPHELSEIEPDSDIAWGSLDNGFRYALLPHAASPGRIAMRLSVSVGSIDELEDEQGLAHFVEHMAFAGTKHFPPGALNSFFQKLGMDFGGDVTAFTYHDRTVYHLELPNNDVELIEQSLGLYRDFADGILFERESVAVEREIILREKQARDTPRSRLGSRSSRIATAGTLIPKRNPIGKLSVLESANKESLSAFYEKWYRPELMTLVVVGDIDAQVIEQQIEQAFSSLQPGALPVPPRLIGRVNEVNQIEQESYAMPGLDRFHVEAIRSWNEDRDIDSWKLRERDYYRSFAAELLNERCRRNISGMNDQFVSYRIFMGIPIAQMLISIGGSWGEGVTWIDRHVRQAHRFGFDRDEIDQLRDIRSRSNEARIDTFNSMPPSYIADSLVDAIETNRVFLSPEANYEFNRKILKKINRAKLKRAFRACWDLNAMTYFVAGNFENIDNTHLIPLLAVNDRRQKMKAYRIKKASALDFTPLGTEGDVVASSAIKGLEGAFAHRFENNTRLTHMQTAYDKGFCEIAVRIGGGLLEFDGENPAAHRLALNALFRSGFGSNSMDQIYSAIRSRIASFGFSTEEHDAFVFYCSANEEGARLFLKLVAEYLLKADIDRNAFSVAKLKYRQLRMIEPSGAEQGYRDLQKVLFGQQPRFIEPSLQEIDELSFEETREWIHAAFKEGFLEVVMAGDIKREDAVDMVGRTLGALPERRKSKPGYDEARRLMANTPAGESVIEYPGDKGENAFAVVMWNIPDHGLSLREDASLFALSRILENRFHDKLRQQLGKTYAPSVAYSVQPAYERIRHFRADIDCLVQDVEKVIALAKGMARDLLVEPLSQEEARRATIPMQDSLEVAWRENSFLVNSVLSGYYEYPNGVQNALHYRNGLLDSLDAKEIQAAALKFLDEERQLSVAIVPQGYMDVARAASSEPRISAGVASP